MTQTFDEQDQVWNFGHCILGFIWDLYIVIWDFSDFTLEREKPGKQLSFLHI